MCSCSWCVAIPAIPPCVLSTDFSTRLPDLQDEKHSCSHFSNSSVPTLSWPTCFKCTRTSSSLSSAEAECYKLDFPTTRALSLTLELNLERKWNSTSLIISVHISALSHKKTCESLDTISPSIHKIRRAGVKGKEQPKDLYAYKPNHWTQTPWG